MFILVVILSHELTVFFPRITVYDVALDLRRRVHYLRLFSNSVPQISCENKSICYQLQIEVNDFKEVSQSSAGREIIQADHS